MNFLEKKTAFVAFLGALLVRMQAPEKADKILRDTFSRFCLRSTTIKDEAEFNDMVIVIGTLISCSMADDELGSLLLKKFEELTR